MSSTLDEWVGAACAELDLDERLADQRAILDLAREVAHRVDRPAAPLTAFLLGLAVGGGQPIRPTADRLLALAAAWNRPAD
jgi:hypothetical protein